LIGYPDIFDVIYFQKFLEIHPQKFKEFNVDLFGNKAEYDEEEEDELENEKIGKGKRYGKSAGSGGSENM